jgi:hypothetical protein
LLNPNQQENARSIVGIRAKLRQFAGERLFHNLNFDESNRRWRISIVVIPVSCVDGCSRSCFLPLGERRFKRVGRLNNNVNPHRTGSPEFQGDGENIRFLDAGFQTHRHQVNSHRFQFDLAMSWDFQAASRQHLHDTAAFPGLVDHHLLRNRRFRCEKLISVVPNVLDLQIDRAGPRTLEWLRHPSIDDNQIARRDLALALTVRIAGDHQQQ